MTKKMRYAAYAGVFTAMLLCALIVYGFCSFLHALDFGSATVEADKRISNLMEAYLEKKYHKDFILAGKAGDFIFQFYPNGEASQKFYVQGTGENFEDNYQEICDRDAIESWFSEIMLNDYYCTVTLEDTSYSVVVLYTDKLNTSRFSCDCTCPNFRAELYEVTMEELYEVRAAHSVQVADAVHSHTITNNAGNIAMEGL